MFVDDSTTWAFHPVSGEWWPHSRRGRNAAAGRLRPSGRSPARSLDCRCARPTGRASAPLNLIPFYEKLGFRREFENHRYEGSQEGRVSPGVRLMRDDDLDALPDLDRTYFGADRGRVLRRLVSGVP